MDGDLHLVALSLFFAPFYIRSRGGDLPDFLEKRYNRACRDWLAVVSIISAVFIHIGFSLYTGAVVLRGLFGIDITLSIVGVAVLTGLYTTVGGLLAVVLTESIQTIILIAGAVAITLFGFSEVGGWSGLVSSVDPVKLTILRPAGDPSGLPWYSVFLATRSSASGTGARTRPSSSACLARRTRITPAWGLSSPDSLKFFPYSSSCCRGLSASVS